MQHSFSPGNGGNQLNSAIALSATNVWAAGNYGLHVRFGDGLQHAHRALGRPNLVSPVHRQPWHQQRVLRRSWFFLVECLGRRQLPVGYHDQHADRALERQDVGDQAKPKPGDRAGSEGTPGVTLISPSDAWTVGFYDDEHTIVEHWNGSAWRLHASP